MKKTDRNSLIVFPILILIGILVALAGSQGGVSIFGIPVFAVMVGLAFLIQWLAFIPAYILQTEKFLDLTGSMTYIAVTALAVCFSAGVDSRSIILAALVIIWAIRLGYFLFSRIKKQMQFIFCNLLAGKFTELIPFIQIINFLLQFR